MAPITLSQRVFLIIHLSLLFSWLFCRLFSPYLLDQLHQKELHLIHNALITPFPGDESIGANWQRLLEKPPLTFLDSLGQFKDLSPYEIIGIFLNLTLPFLIFFQFNGSRELTWLLPLCTLLLYSDIYINNVPQTASHHERLFPKEEELIGASSISRLEQRKYLQDSFDRYLLNRYSLPQEDLSLAKDYFLRERFTALTKDYLALKGADKRVNPFLLLLFLVWQVIMAKKMRGRRYLGAS